MICTLRNLILLICLIFWFNELLKTTDGNSDQSDGTSLIVGTIDKAPKDCTDLKGFYDLSNKKPSVENLREHCRRNLSAQKTPSVWIQVPEFPLTGSGKVQKFAIREKYLSGEYGKVLR